MEFVENTPIVDGSHEQEALKCSEEDQQNDQNIGNYLQGLSLEEYRVMIQDLPARELYVLNKERYMNMALQSHGKHGLLPKASRGIVDTAALQSHAEIVRTHAHKSDFSIIQLTRFLHFHNPEVDQHRGDIELIMKEFSFWTGKTKQDSRRKAMEHTIFWSENHIFMYLSSAYLFHQYMCQSCPHHASSACVNEHDRDQLLIYLDSHCHPKFNGVYEVLSCTYLPWTICALLNLYDFALDEGVREKAKMLLDIIVTTFCLVATRDGICNLTASARQYQDLRTKTWNHNVTLLIILMTGVIYDPQDMKPSPLGDFFATSSYQPPDDIVENYFRFHGSIMRKRMNHLVKETKEIYLAGKGPREVKDRELIPFYWSAGLITHPRFVEDTLEYIEKYNLSKNPGISALSYLPKKLAKGVMKSADSLSKGQTYASIFLNIFKSPSRAVVMTSFEQYNVGRHAYQQNTWMVNLNGVGVWSQSGTAVKEEQLNVANPSVSQQGNVLVAAYNIDHRRISSADLFWPRQYFTSEYRQNTSGGPFYPTQPGEPRGKNRGDDTQGVGTKKDTWWIACRENMYIGVYCTEPTEEDWSHREDTKMQFFRHDPIVNIPTRKCNHSTVCWVVVVGDTTMYPNLADFQTYCTQLSIHDRVNQKKQYIVRVLSGATTSENVSDGEVTEGDDDAKEAACESWRDRRGDSMCRDPVDIKVVVNDQ